MSFLKFFKSKTSNAPAICESQKADDLPFNNTEKNRVALTKPVPDFSSTHRSIMEIWDKVGVKLCTVEADIILYSGIRSRSPIMDTEEFLEGRSNLWMSQSAFYAGEYCYRNSGPATYGALLKLRITRPVTLLEFPNNFHPATAFFEYAETESGFEVDYASPPRYQWFEHGQADHHVDIYFREIVKNGNFKTEPVGHMRRTIEHGLGAVPGQIIELYISDFSTIEVVDWIVPPATKLEYIELIGSNRENAASVLFP